MSLFETMKRDMVQETHYVDPLALSMASFLWRELENHDTSHYFFQGDDVVDRFLRSALGNKWVVYWQSPLTFSEIRQVVQDQPAVRDWFLRRFGALLAQESSPEHLEQIIASLERRFTVFNTPAGSGYQDLLLAGEVESLQVDKELTKLMVDSNPWAFYFLYMLDSYLGVFGNTQLLRHVAKTQQVDDVD